MTGCTIAVRKRKSLLVCPVHTDVFGIYCIRTLSCFELLKSVQIFYIYTLNAVIRYKVPDVRYFLIKCFLIFPCLFTVPSDVAVNCDSAVAGFKFLYHHTTPGRVSNLLYELKVSRGAGNSRVILTSLRHVTTWPFVHCYFVRTSFGWISVEFSDFLYNFAVTVGFDSGI